MTSVEEIAARLSEAQREALLDDDRDHYQAIILNAVELVHIDVVKDAYGRLISMTHRPTPLGLEVRAYLTKGEDHG